MMNCIYNKKLKATLFCILSLCLPLFLQSCRSIPDWVRDPYTKYDRQTTVAAVGSASSFDAAEAKAYINLVGFFGQNINFDERIIESYRETVRNRLTSRWTANTEIDNILARAIGFNNLIGAEIGDRYKSGNNYFAVAILA